MTGIKKVLLNVYETTANYNLLHTIIIVISLNGIKSTTK